MLILKLIKTNYKTDIHCKNCQKHTECTNPKYQTKKAKAKSKCAEYLTDRIFFDKISDKYDLE